MDLKNCTSQLGAENGGTTFKEVLCSVAGPFAGPQSGPKQTFVECNYVTSSYMNVSGQKILTTGGDVIFSESGDLQNNIETRTDIKIDFNLGKVVISGLGTCRL